MGKSASIRAPVTSKPYRIALLLVLSTAGCSFLAVNRPVGKELDQYHACTTTYWYPVLDSAMLAVPVAGAINIALDYSGSSAGRAASLALDATLGTAALASAIYGYYYVAKCRGQVAAAHLAEPIAGPTAEPALVPLNAAAPLPRPATPRAPKLRGKHLVVLEFQSRDLDADTLMAFADETRGGALEGLKGQGVEIMSRDNLAVILRRMGDQECGEGDCEVETARNVGADYVISGRVVKIEGSLVVTLKLHETKLGSLLGSETVEGPSKVAVLRDLHGHGQRLVTSAFGLDRATPPGR